VLALATRLAPQGVNPHFLVAGRFNSLGSVARRPPQTLPDRERRHTEKEPTMKRTLVAGLTTAALVSGGLGLGAGTAQAYNYGPFQWCPGQDLPNDPPRPDGSLVWDMSVCHTYYFDYDIRDPGTPARYWEGPNLFPTPIPPPPPPVNPPNISQQCPGLIPFVNCLPGL
jgi:hypothetical protein